MKQPGIDRLVRYHLNGRQTCLWRRVVGSMGPRWGVLPAANLKTLQALKRHNLAEFEDGGRLRIGRLTARGTALRDRWLRLEVVRLDRLLIADPGKVGNEQQFSVQTPVAQ